MRTWLFCCIVSFYLLPHSSSFGAQARSLPLDVLTSRSLATPSNKVVFNSETEGFVTESGRRLNARLMVPKSAKGTERYPVLLLFGGFEEAAHVLEMLHPEVPIILTSFDYPFTPPRKFSFPASLKFAPEAREAIRDTVSGIVELCKVLRQRKDVDPARITVVGASFGAPFALAAAAADPEIGGVVLVHAFGEVRRTVQHLIVRSWAPTLGMLANPLAWMLAKLGWWYLKAPEPEHSARLLTSKQKVLFISAEFDTFIPKESSQALWASLEESQAQHERISMPGDHLQPGADKLISEITAIVTSWMQRADLR